MAATLTGAETASAGTPAAAGLEGRDSVCTGGVSGESSLGAEAVPLEGACVAFSTSLSWGTLASESCCFLFVCSVFTFFFFFAFAFAFAFFFFFFFFFFARFFFFRFFFFFFFRFFFFRFFFAIRMGVLSP
ncbi:MAG: hypothetical protein CMH50_03025 [Myxococcales bacterium]|nr:hypothetical protein [Myxococcales bacterium]